MSICGKILPQIELNGRIFVARAVIRDTIAYLPVVPIAVALNTKLEWRAAESTLKTAYGEVTGYEKRKQIYCNADDAVLLFNIDGGLQSTNEGKIYRLKTITPPPEVIDPTTINKPKTEKPKTDKPKEDKPQNEKPKTDKPAEKSDTDKPKTDKSDELLDKPFEKSKKDKSETEKAKIDKSKENPKEVDKPFEDKKSAKAEAV